MKTIFIKYNPYKLETEILVERKGLALNSKLAEKSVDGSRLQEWVEELPRLLIDEYNDTHFEITFHGTLLDYEDLTSVFYEANEKNEITATLIHKPAKETTDKEALIDEVFNEIQKGPFDELRSTDIINSFEQAKSSDFEVCVVATMSSGKSTLINAMLGTKLMPSKQEACTAIITKIKDCSQDMVPFKAEVYSKGGQLIETHENLTCKVMECLNSDENVSVIQVSGNIPFVSSDDVSLVLIDTPGPNNARDPRHKKVQSELLGKSSKALVLFIMTVAYASGDDDILLKRVAESMCVGGKQSKDRFIFVVNKMDTRDEDEDGDTEETLEGVRSYLKTHGISNPNLFPASALPALNIRLIENGSDVSQSTRLKTPTDIIRHNCNETFHLENYANLPSSISNTIREQLVSTSSEWNGKEFENPKEALIHTGIISIEAAIRQYVEKYAKTAKIKNIVDTFTHKLDEAECFEETKRELAKNQKESQRIIEMIDSIREKMDSAQDAKKFKDTVDDTIAKISARSEDTISSLTQKFQEKITKQTAHFCGQEFTITEAEEATASLKRFIEQLEPEFEVELDTLIKNSLINTSVALLESYKKKLSSLTKEIDIESTNGITINPLKLMGGCFSTENISINKFVKEKDIQTGQEWIANTDKKWYKPWTWLEEDGYYRKLFQSVQYIEGDTLAQGYSKPLQESLYSNGNIALEHAINQSKQIVTYFNTEFKRLDNILEVKLTELEQCMRNKEMANELIKESERKLAWLESIKSKVESILEI